MIAQKWPEGLPSWAWDVNEEKAVQIIGLITHDSGTKAIVASGLVMDFDFLAAEGDTLFSGERECAEAHAKTSVDA